MIVHVLTLRWVDELPDGHVERVTAALRRLPSVIPQLRRYDVGSDLGVMSGNADFAVVATFDSLDDWRAYGAHPEHAHVRDTMIVPFIASAHRVQFDTSG